MRSIKFIFYSLLFFSLNTQAEDVKVEDVANPLIPGSVVASSNTIAANDGLFSIWSSEAELGFVQTTGNTETESLNLKFAIDNKRKSWEHSLKLAAVKSSDGVGTTSERYLILVKSQYMLSESSYLFDRLQYEDDRFSGYDYQASEVIGYGRHLVSSDTFKMNAELGVGARQNAFENAATQTEGIVIIATDFEWMISKSASLTEDLTIDIGDDRTISKSVTALTTKINSSLSSKITYTVKHASEVPVGTENTDTELAATLVYTFK